MKLWVVAIGLVCCACVSSKGKIERGEARSTQAATAIRTDAAAGKAELGAVLDLPTIGESARPTIETAADRFEAIEGEADHVLDANAMIRDGLQGVKNKINWGRWFLLAILLVIGLVVLTFVAPGVMLKLGIGIPRAMRASASLLKATRDAMKSGDTEEARRRLDSAVASMRASRRFETAWEEEGRK